jgi:hypothetical protein
MWVWVSVGLCGQFVVLSRTTDGLTVGFQQVPEPESGKNRLHGA